jgi:glutathione S-transferase
MLELYDSHISPCAQKVRIVLHQKALSWTDHQLDLQAEDQFKPAYKKLNPNSVVPTLVHDGVVFNESTIINEYLDDTFPTIAMRPKDPVHLARMRHWVKRVDDGAHAAIGMLSFSTTRRHQLRAKMTAEQLQAHIDNIPNDYQRMWQREVIAHGVEAPIVTGAVRLYDRLLDDMNSTLTDSTYLVGDVMTLADAAMAPYVTRLDWLAMDELWRDTRPAVSR